MPEEKECFIICPIGEEGSPIRKRADLVFEYIIRPIAEECGYKTIRADHISESGIITDQIIQKIIDAPMAIADLTDLNPNVFYELAVRHLFQKPVIHIIEEQEKIPFDVSAMRTIVLDYTDVKSHREAKQQLKGHIKAAETATGVRNPISIAFDSRALQSSTDPERRGLGEVLSEVREIKAMITNLSQSKLMSKARRGFLDEAVKEKMHTLAEILEEQQRKEKETRMRALSEALSEALKKKETV